MIGESSNVNSITGVALSSSTGTFKQAIALLQNVMMLIPLTNLFELF
jgi:hypothetical protein